jgi:hypothetical protein
MLAGKFPATLPVGDYCPTVGLGFENNTPVITPVISNADAANNARPGCTFANAEETVVDFHLPNQTLLREERCGP